MIILTEFALIQATRAKATLVRQSADESTQDLCLRLKARNAECAGLIYGISFDKKNEFDEVKEMGGLTIVVDPTSYSFLKNATLSFDVLKRKFEFVNPDIKKCTDCDKECDTHE